MQQLLVSHSFSTKAYSVRYRGEWIHAIGKADFTIHAVAKAPNNTINYFGRGNETEFNKTGDYVTYHRTRFSTYLVEPGVRWRNNRGSSLTIGPSLLYYELDPDDNTGRFISDPKQIGSYDSSSVEESKLHLGIFAEYINDTRNYKILPQKGHYFKVRLEAYQGMGDFAESFAQLIPEFAVYKTLNKKKSIVLADRLGGSVSVGKTAFYQSAFIGGQENLLGYRQYRFAGQHCAYNNLELRIKIADIANYILPGQLGISTFWDIGRVWVEDDESHKWHNGVGAGIYFAPASLISFSFVMGYSNEGWYPYFTMGFRF
jgi:outer membrane protein assembly factor BamA